MRKKSTNGRLAGKVAIITGGGTGIGKATALLFAHEGASVVVAGPHPDKLLDVVAEIESSNGLAMHFVLDVSSASQWRDLVQSTVSAFGKIDILVNNAGISGNLALGLADRTEAEFQQVINVNLVSQFLGLKEVAPFLKSGASVVNVSSIAGITGNAGANAYTASKGGTRLFSKGAAIEMAAKGIRVNSVHPGFVSTPMTNDMPGAAEFRKMALSHTPMGRAADPMEIATSILFIASDDASFITGAELIVDGGFTAF
ncbi:SDR family NAD(P)-dependent oxidoreductase [Parachryseolinea silvisoli]|uniref:SDR family NAD(P)-dependent oxidoreductase n=1 Tax=Parachryseolinea silvisoli TaxID=2873601 RepID=UPI0022658615|nr:SDR family oxidoreductase [Parachryseolinea silvisoli]MCD9017685.1 SDR family oxidoreductase [Parachryseolinea silvisoli]